MNTQADRVREKFRALFGSEPGVWFSPGRINLIGEHVDYNDGYVMPAAINKGVWFAIARNDSDTIRFHAADLDESFSIPVQQLQRQEGWKNYVLGVLHELRLLQKNITGFDCVFGGDIPRGSGMSSSAAVEGGLAYALNELFGFGMSRTELALLCQRAEHNYPGVKCGIMDMYASLHGKKDHVLLLDCQRISHEYFPLKLDGYSIVLLNSKVHHSLASGEYNIRRHNCEEGLALLKEQLPVHSFRDITSVERIEPFRERMRPEVYSCCRYVIEEIRRTRQAAACLQQNSLVGLGQLMFETHEGLSGLYKVGCAETDFLVEQAKNNTSVIGARQMGGGFGGCTINLVKTEAVDDFMEQCRLAYQNRFSIALEGYVMETADGTGKIE